MVIFASLTVLIRGDVNGDVDQLVVDGDEILVVEKVGCCQEVDVVVIFRHETNGPAKQDLAVGGAPDEEEPIVERFMQGVGRLGKIGGFHGECRRTGFLSSCEGNADSERCDFLHRLNECRACKEVRGGS